METMTKNMLGGWIRLEHAFKGKKIDVLISAIRFLKEGFYGFFKREPQKSSSTDHCFLSSDFHELWCSVMSICLLNGLC